MTAITTLPEGYVLQQVGTSALREADGTFRPAVPVYILVSAIQAAEAEAKLVEDSARLFGRMYRQAMEARYEQLTGEQARLPKELQ